MDIIIKAQTNKEPDEYPAIDSLVIPDADYDGTNALIQCEDIVWEEDEKNGIIIATMKRCYLWNGDDADYRGLARMRSAEKQLEKAYLTVEDDAPEGEFYDPVQLEYPGRKNPIYIKN